ncbi:hypothetical protein NDU88_007099, partial [Pleurodeles waltl]
TFFALGEGCTDHQEKSLPMEPTISKNSTTKNSVTMLHVLECIVYNSRHIVF